MNGVISHNEWTYQTRIAIEYFIQLKALIYKVFLRCILWKLILAWRQHPDIRELNNFEM